MTSETKLEAWMVERLREHADKWNQWYGDQAAESLLKIAHAIEAELARTGEMERKSIYSAIHTEVMTLRVAFKMGDVEDMDRALHDIVQKIFDAILSSKEGE